MKDHSPAPYLSHLTEGGFAAHMGLRFAAGDVGRELIFSFSGTELIGVAAGESIDPHTTIPRHQEHSIAIGDFSLSAQSLSWPAYCLPTRQV